MATGFSKTRCVHCRGKIEFPNEGAGLSVACPHCGNATILKRPRLSRQDMNILICVGAVFFVIGVVGFCDFVASEYKKREEQARRAERQREEETQYRIQQAQQALWAAQAPKQPSYLEQHEARMEKLRNRLLLERQARALEEANSIARHRYFDESMSRSSLSPSPSWEEQQTADAIKRIADEAEEANRLERQRQLYRTIR